MGLRSGQLFTLINDRGSEEHQRWPKGKNGALDWLPVGKKVTMDRLPVGKNVRM